MVEGVRDPAALAGEDEQLRSPHIHAMLAAHMWTPAEAAGRQTAARTSIPRVIVQFWDAPMDVPADVDSWSPLLHRGFRRLIFGDTSAR